MCKINLRSGNAKQRTYVRNKLYGDDTALKRLYKILFHYHNAGQFLN